MRVNLFLVLFLAFVIGGRVEGQEWKVYNKSNSGLPENVVSVIAIDNAGNKWIGTYGGGLAKFDGERWTVYGESNSELSSNWIISVAIDREGNKWIGTERGLIKFDGVRWAVYDKSNSGLPDNKIYAIAIDNSGNKWIGTNGGVTKFDGVKWTVYNKANSRLPSNNITAIAIDKFGNKWIGTWGGGVAKFDGASWTIYNRSNSGLPDNYVYAVAIDSAGNKWIGTYGGLARFEGIKRWKVYNESNSDLPDNNVLAIAIDDSGNKWIGTNGGLAKFDGVNWTVYNTLNSILPSNIVRAIMVDNENVKWIGTGGGLVKIEPLYPPVLSVDVSFKDESGDLVLSVKESGVIVLKIKNTGKGEAKDFKVKIEPSRYPGLSYQSEYKVGNIPPGSEKVIEIPVIASENVSTDEVNFVIKFSEEFGFEPSPVNLKFETRVYPPVLSVDVSFKDESGDLVLSGKESGIIVLKIKNTGKGKATDFKVKIEPGKYPGLSYWSEYKVGDIPPGSEKVVKIPVFATEDVSTGAVNFVIKFSEGSGFEPSPVNLKFETRELVPDLDIFDVGVYDASGNGKIEPGEAAQITVRIENKGSGSAKDVKVKIRPGKSVFLAGDSKDEFYFSEIKPGEFVDVRFTAYTGIGASEMPIYVDISEKYGRFGKSGLRLPLEFNKAVSRIAEVVVEPRGEDRVVVKGRDEAGLSVDIEVGIPETGVKNRNAVALIIAISDYEKKEVPKVEYAKRDAEFVREYLIKVLGYEPENILPRDLNELMTFAKMRTYVRNILPSFLRPDGTSEVFVYFTGHGAPGVGDEPYLVPYDADPNFLNSDNAYRLGEFLSDISRLNAKRKIVVIDACYSGYTGRGELLVKRASPALLRVRGYESLGEGMIVFQSSKIDQVSNWYPEKRHSMFTYFFLKGLRGEADYDGDGLIRVGEMERFINDVNDGLPYWSNRLFLRRQECVVYGDRNEVLVRRK